MVLRILIFLALSSSVFSQKLINQIIIEGNVAYSDERIKDILFSAEGEELLIYKINRDKRLIENLYIREGFIEVEVNYITKPFSVRNNLIIDDVIFQINENFQSRFGNLTIIGNNKVPLSKLKSFFNGKPNDPYSNEKVKNLIEQIRDHYKQIGYPNLNITLNTPSQAENNFIKDIVITLNENNIVYFRDVIFKSPFDSIPLVTKKALIMQEVEFRKGELYNENHVKETQKYLYELNLFQNVSISFNHIKHDTIDSMDVIIELTERKTSYVGISAGITEDYGLSYTLNNKNDDVPFYKRLTYEANFDAGKRNWKGTGAEIGLGVNPVWYFDEAAEFTNFSNKFRIYSNFLNFPFHRWQSFIELSTLRIFHPDLGSFSRFNINYRTTLKLGIKSSLDFTMSNDVNEINTEESSQILTLDDRRRLGLTDNNIFSIGSSFRLDERDNQTNPKDGFYIRTSIKASATSGLESQAKDVNYFTTQFEWRRYQRMFDSKRFTLATNFRLGGIFSSGDSKDNFDLIPIFERFYMGNSLRGFKYNQFGRLIASVDTTNNTTAYTAKGGRAIFVTNLELRYLLTKLFDNDLYTQTFVDIGGLWENFNEINLSSIRATYGLGISYFIKFLVIRLDYGFIYDPRKLNIIPNENFPNLKAPSEDTGTAGEYSFGISFHF